MIRPEVMQIAREVDLKAWRKRRVTHQRPWPRALAAAALWLGYVAVLTAGIGVALAAWELLFRKLLGGIGNGLLW